MKDGLSSTLPPAHPSPNPAPLPIPSLLPLAFLCQVPESCSEREGKRETLAFHPEVLKLPPHLFHWIL